MKKALLLISVFLSVTAIAAFPIARAAEPNGISIPRVLDNRLKLELFAAEPEIVTPTGIATDAKGRVLAIESNTHFRPKDYDRTPADRVRRFSEYGGETQPR